MSEGKPNSEKPTSGGDKTPIYKRTEVIVAFLALVGVIVSSLLAPVVLRLMDRNSSPASTTAYTTAAIAVVLTDTPTPTPTLTETVTPTPTPIPNTQTPTYTLTPVTPTSVPTAALFGEDCILDGEVGFFFYPPKDNIQPVGDCWKLDSQGLSPIENGLRIERVTVLGDDQQSGLYIPLNGDTDIQFDFQVDRFRCDNLQPLNSRQNVAFGITELEAGSRFTYNGIILYYRAGNVTDASNRLQLVGYPDTLYVDMGLKRAIKFSITSSTLKIFVGNLDQSVSTQTLPAGNKAFYLGYKLKDKCDLNATLRDFQLSEP